MKGPISYAIAEGHRVSAATKPIDWTTSHQWSFAPINEKQFPAVSLARHCGELGGGATTIYNAANEVAVEAFINEAITFTSIVKVVEASVNALATGTLTIRDLSDVSAIEQDARLNAERFISQMRS
jgi:1-deoxy-D-xylulose-5-phosphate reductoisomerase